MPRSIEVIRAQMHELERRLDQGKISEKVFELRFKALQDELDELKNLDDPGLPGIVDLGSGLSCRKFAVGMVLGEHYRVVRELGRGGMGVVYLADDLNFEGKRQVALKVLPEQLRQDPEGVEEFKEEFLSASRLVHQYICAMHEFGEDCGADSYYLVMEYLPGQTLRRKLRQQGPYDVAAVLPLIEQICAGLGYAHSQGVLHLDLKPANIMVLPHGGIKLMDFGLARRLSASMSHVSLKHSLGTPLYMAPEQLDPRSAQKQVTMATDLWSLAVTIYELLSGTPPFDGPTAYHISEAILQAAPVPIQGLPAPLWSWLQKALAKNPQDRPPDCASFYQGLWQAWSVTCQIGSAIGIQACSRPPTSTAAPAPPLATAPSSIPVSATPSSPSSATSSPSSATPSFPTTATSSPATTPSPPSVPVSGPSAVCASSASVHPAVASGVSQETAATAFPMIALSLNPPDGWPSSLWKVCWNAREQWLYFSLSPWCQLSPTEQLRYAAVYQQWYARYKDLPVSKIVRVAKVNFKLLLIPPGKFWMGSPSHEAGHHPTEKRHIVVITQPFWMAKHAVTQSQWQAVTRKNPARFSSRFQDRRRCPVEQVSWSDCQTFCKKVGLVLPTEAQWEYACRAGTTTPCNLGNNITTKQFNYDGTSSYAGGPVGSYRRRTTPVGTLPNANAWGLYDMHGNVNEWCQDRYHEEYYQHSPVKDPCNHTEGEFRVFRGGSWSSPATEMRSAHRSCYGATLRYRTIGLRLVVEVLPTEG